MVAMVNIAWGYDRNTVKASNDILEVKDKYFALRSKTEDQSYFQKVGIEPTVVVNGFTYRFCNFEKNQSVLREKYNTHTVRNEPTVIQMVLNERGNIGVSSTTTLGYFSVTHPEEYKKLLISEINDSVYHRHFIIRNDAVISPEIFNEYLQSIKNNGTFQTILKKYGLQ
ncbi:amino acid ABC transporter substrate-binding protein [Desulfobotulus mexicanus]|uniref:Amino acid ABC transporter substrate-binding protein n=1 Tax=Desulfobotulus mexicanus TaxID=2586642 RepID=A0A5S5MCY1_9BACT|nr:amino acid ABC transporter substrate-binding protein [Desulfobotulus mexicanus]TYT73561.1 amino acid ABC transporter substrate-binding protein [Desulfobotulus mexicanus]